MSVTPAHEPARHATGTEAGRERSTSLSLLSGRFQARFGDERTARAAARDASGADFAVTVQAQSSGGWSVAGRRRQPFPADDSERYASRLRAIAVLHGGDYDGFVPDA